VIETARLTLRRFREDDLDALAATLGDPRVGDWLGGVRSRDQCAANIAAWTAELDRSGFGRLAMMRKANGRVIGAVGLHRLDPAFDPTPVGGAVEIGWHLDFAAWGAGYASEAARAVTADGLERVGLSEIVAFTAKANLRSQAVMVRLGYERQTHRDFDHPNLAPDHPLSRHVVYAVRRT
jgi:RimJ/RimL family protein N-acetyltransferase